MKLKRTTVAIILAALLLNCAITSDAKIAAATPRPARILDTPAPTATLCPFRYTDVPPSHWAYQYIGQLTCIGAISGYPDGSFLPATNMQRDQVAKVIVLAKGWQIQHLNQIFSDVPPSYWAYDLIQTSYAYAAVTGYRDNQTIHPCADHGVASPCYLPHNNITRAELTSVVVRMQGWAPYDPANPSFTDVPRNYWAYQFIEAGHLHGIINGYPDGSFRPNNNITRAEVCKVVGLGISSP